MGLEDREWYRDDLRKKGHSASWDNFKAGKPRTEAGEPDEPPVLSPEHPDYDEGRLAGIRRLMSRGEVFRPKAKRFVPPSYAHLLAEEILEARKAKREKKRLVLCLLALIASLLVYVAFQVP